jgi:hypothetical protein
VEVTFIGSGDAFGSGGRFQTCIRVRAEEPVRYHLDYRTLREHACELAAGRLVLTHMGPKMLARLCEAEHAAAVDGLALHAGML